MNGLYDLHPNALDASARPREIRKRQPAEDGGYVCQFPGCGRAFNRQSELSKHGKYHLPEADRPFMCDTCSKRFLFQKDLKRHEEAQHPESVKGHHSTDEAKKAYQPENSKDGVPQDHAPMPHPGRPYRYQALPSDRSIRLLTLRPGVGSENLHCSLSSHDLVSDGAPYDALSYAWGSEPRSKSIYVQEGGYWTTIAVTPKLVGALKHLSNLQSPRPLWVDAVCINQDDSMERSRQVAIMGQIYGNANNVCIWLGEQFDNSELAMRFVQNKVSTLGVSGEITSTKEFFQEWKALAALMSRPWFQRRWVVQEVCLAKSATVHCGSETVPWKDFEMAVSLFERDAPRIAKLFRNFEEAEYGHDLFEHVEALGAARLVQIMSKLLLKDDKNSVIEYRYPLCDLVTELSSFKATQWHDIIYALLSLAKDTHHRTIAKDDSTANPSRYSSETVKSTFADIRKRTFDATQLSSRCGSSTTQIEAPSDSAHVKRARVDTNTGCSELSFRDKYLAKRVTEKLQQNARAAHSKPMVFHVDYNQSIFEVYKQFIEFTLEHGTSTNKLDIICRPWAPTGASSELPSWIPDFADSAFHISGKQIARKNHDSLVSQSVTPNHVTVSYNACRGQSMTGWRFGDPNDDEDKFSLLVFGFILDRIGEIETFSQLGNIPAEWFYLAGWHPWDEKGNYRAGGPPDQLWKTLVANRSLDGSSPKIYYSRAFEYAVKNSTPTTGLEATVLARRSNSIVMEFLERMTAVVWNRKLFRTADHGGLLGLASKRAKEHDRK